MSMDEVDVDPRSHKSPVCGERRKRYKSGNTYSLTLLCVHSYVEWLGKWMMDRKRAQESCTRSALGSW